MCYTITARVFHANPGAYFRIVEKAVWLNGIWSEVNGTHVLRMGDSGTCGSLRFVSDTDDEKFIVTLGVHAQKRWGDIVTNLGDKETTVVITPQYYGGQHREFQRVKQLTTYQVENANGRKISFKYTVAQGNDLKVDIYIGSITPLFSPYTIIARVFHTNPSTYFHVVEKTVWCYGTWDEVDGTHVLRMGDSETYGSLRFVSDADDEKFIVILGVYNYKCWGDIVTNLTNETGVVITPQYYFGSQYRRDQREKQLTAYQVKNSKGREIAFKYTVAEGNDLEVDISMG